MDRVERLHHASHRRHALGAQGGFSLIEILVAVLIVSVGVLGVAGLQLISLQNNTSAMFRTQAAQAAYEIVDRMRANAGQDYTLDIDDAAPAFDDCEAALCTPAEMRDYDLGSWLTDVVSELPNGDGGVAIVAGGAGTVVTITVRWQDDRNVAVAPLEITVTTTL